MSAESKGMRKILPLGLSICLIASAMAQVTNQSISPAFNGGFMLICKWDHDEAHTQVRLHGHGDYENAEVKIIERHSEDMIYQTKLFKTESEESLLQISVSLERYSGRIDWNESSGDAYSGYCRPAAERLF